MTYLALSRNPPNFLSYSNNSWKISVTMTVARFPLFHNLPIIINVDVIKGYDLQESTYNDPMTNVAKKNGIKQNVQMKCHTVKEI